MAFDHWHKHESKLDRKSQGARKFTLNTHPGHDVTFIFTILYLHIICDVTISWRFPCTAFQTRTNVTLGARAYLYSGLPTASSGLPAFWRFASRLIQRTYGTQCSNGDGHTKVNTLIHCWMSLYLAACQPPCGLPAPYCGSPRLGNIGRVTFNVWVPRNTLLLCTYNNQLIREDTII